MGSKGEPDSPLVAASHFAYRRTPTDRPWAFVFLGAWVAAVACGIVAVRSRNPLYAQLSHDYLADGAHCPLDPHQRRLLQEEPLPFDPQFELGDFVGQAAGWVAAAVAVALLMGGLALHLFKEHAPLMTRATVYAQIAFPALLGVFCTVTGMWLMAGPMFGMAVLTSFIFYLWRDQIALASSLLSVSARGLVANPGLIGATVLLNLVSVLSISPLLTFAVYAYANGSVVPNPARHGGVQCVDSESKLPVACCAWEPSAPAVAYMVCAVLLLLWTMMTWQQVRVFLVSGTIAQWYFAPPHMPGTRGTTLRSLKHAVGPQLGTLCFGGAILSITHMIRNAAKREGRDNQRNSAGAILKLVVWCLASCLAGIIEFLTKFATVYSAITGDAFFAAGRQVTSLLARNYLDAFASTVWFVPTVINLASFTLSLVWGAACGAGYYLAHSSPGELHHATNSVLLGFMAMLMTSFVLSFLGGVLLSVLDATFVCWAIDKDSNTISHPDVYEAFMAVPLPPGPVVQQPGGGMVYGAPQAQAAYHAPVVHA